MTAKLTTQDKEHIVALIVDKEKQLGSFRSVATHCNVSPATISQMAENKYDTKGDAMWITVGSALGWKLSTGLLTRTWTSVETADYKIVARLLADAKNNSLFMPISDYAGIGKTESLKMFADLQKHNAVYYIRCRDWGKKEMLEQLCRTLGIDAGRGFKTPNTLIDLIIEFFQQRSLMRPLLIMDEADKVKPRGLCALLIHLYNECEDATGVVIAGTENLEKEIKRGVQYSVKGYDELDSRLGRKYIKLIGCTLTDVTRICEANGLSDSNKIKEIFFECKPVRKQVRIAGKEQIIQVITDLRRLKRMVVRETIKTTQN